MTIFWPAFIAGIVIIAAGILVIFNRATLARFNAGAQRATFGRAGERVAKSSTPNNMLMTGVGFVVIGLVGIVMSLLDLSW